MPRPLKVIATTDGFGAKLNSIMAAKGMPGDYKQLAEIFGVTTPSAREWVKFGRFAKERYAKLVEWSGKSLYWWLDVPEPSPGAWGAPNGGEVREPTPPAFLRLSRAWPFDTVSAADYALLDAHARAEAEAFIKGLIANSQRKRANA